MLHIFLENIFSGWVLIFIDCVHEKPLEVVPVTTELARDNLDSFDLFMLFISAMKLIRGVVVVLGVSIKLYES